MPFARIYIPKQKKHQDVDVALLTDFYNIYSSGGDPDKKVFILKTSSSGPQQKCQVLRLADSLHDLHREVAAKRCHVPKLNATLLEDDIDNSQCSLNKDVSQNKKRKTDRIAQKINTQIDSAKEIIRAHRNASSRGETNSRSTMQKKKESASQPQDGDRRKANEKDDHSSTDIFGSDESSQAFETVHDTDDTLFEDASTVVTVREDRYTNPDLIKCYAEIDELKSEVHRWQSLYNDMKSCEQFPLTEKTGKQIIAALIQNENRKPTPADIHADNGNKVPRSADMKDLGGGIQIKKQVYETLTKESEPSKFVINLAHYVWGVETLAQRCVRKQANVDEQQLEDDKKGVVIEHFQDWLKASNYPGNLISKQLEKVNKYFNSAITSARKKIKRIEMDESMRKGKKGETSSMKKKAAPKEKSLLKESIANKSVRRIANKAKPKKGKTGEEHEVSFDSDSTIFNFPANRNSESDTMQDADEATCDFEREKVKSFARSNASNDEARSDGHASEQEIADLK